jgi:hypothetical protein
MGAGPDDRTPDERDHEGSRRWLVMLVQDPETRGRPTRIEPFGSRWWLLLLSTATAGMVMAFIPAVMLEFAVYMTRYEDFPWVLVVASPFALAGLLTAVVAGVGSWYRLVPTLAVLAAATPFLMVDEPAAWLYFLSAWVAIVVGTALGRLADKSDASTP